MNQFSLLILLFAMACQPPTKVVFSASAEEGAIREVLKNQENAWNGGDIDRFMEGYWKSDSLQFIGSQITKGWSATLARYKKSYPDLAAMGKLQFDLYEFEFLSAGVCLVTGRYTLVREQDNPTGMFTLVFQKKGDKWVITYDHTS